MKDFAKSIRTGNALSRGQVLYTRGNKKFVYGGEVNGTHIVYRQPDGKTFSFSSEEGVKQFIKDIPVYESAYVGNISADITTDGNTWFVTTSDGKKKEFTSEREAEEYVKKVKAGNSKVGNATFDDPAKEKRYQSIASMIEEKYDGYRNDKMKQIDGLYKQIESIKESIRKSKDEERKEYENLERKIRAGNSKVGNEDNSDIIRAAKKQLEDAKKFGWAETGYNGWTKKDVEDLEKKIKELEQKQKTGNSSHTKEEAKTKDEYFKILKFYQTQGYRTKAGEYNPNGRIKLHKGDDSVEIVLVGNSKVGNADTYERLNEAIKTARAYSYNAYTRMASPFSSISIINDLSKCKEACDEAIKLVKQYDKERYN